VGWVGDCGVVISSQEDTAEGATYLVGINVLRRSWSQCEASFVVQDDMIYFKQRALL